MVEEVRLVEGKGLRRAGLFLGPILFVIAIAIPAPDLSFAAQAVGGTTLWMATWWVTEAIPIPATALLPLLLLPITGAATPKAAAAPYGSPLIFLFLGGLLLSLALERWGLHRRVALAIVDWVGTGPVRITLGFMLATAFLSMWISNTATTLLMVPIAFAVIEHVNDEQDQPSDQFGTALMLGIAYAASIGGMATLIGSPTNVVTAGLVKELLGTEIDFVQWLVFAAPFSFAFLLVAWFYLTRFAFRLPHTGRASHTIRQLRAELGAMTRQEKIVAVVWSMVALAWLTRPYLLQLFPRWPKFDDSTIAIAGALLLFVIPSGAGSKEGILNWDVAVKVPWGILILFGGGLSLASAFTQSKLAVWLGSHLAGFGHIPALAGVFIVTIFTLFLTEFTSNVATATLLMPVLAEVGKAFGMDPLMLMMSAALAVSGAFMLPVATPPNAIVFGTGFLTVPKMARAGLVLNLIGSVLITVFVYWWLPLLW
ncbi:MAG: SLC13 family permease [Gemmatales bacterium]|nr:MAG: SLC13 family permease [Gemmatales bacterium]